MENDQLITLQTFCTSYNVEISFIQSLNEFGLVEIITLNETPYIDKDYLGEIEKMMRMHYDLEINMAGIDAISNLLQRVSELQKEILTLKNRLDDNQ